MEELSSSSGSTGDTGYGAAPGHHSRKRKSAFVFFLEEQQSVRRRLGPQQGCEDGRSFTERIGREWEQMDGETRIRYVQMAAAWNGVNGDNQLTTNGKSIREMQAKNLASQQRALDMAREIEMSVSSTLEKGLLDSTVFHLIDFNLVCRTAQNVYVPSEVAVVECTLADGVRRCFQEFIDSGRIPLGYRHEAVVLSERTHNIPPENFVLAERDHMSIVRNLKHFVQQGQQGSQLKLFCMDSELDKAEKILRVLASGPHPFSLLSLSKWFYELQNACISTLTDLLHLPNDEMKQLNLPSALMAESLLQRDEFEYTPASIACHFHNALENSRFCALSRVVRQAYVIMKHCCKPSGVELRAGSHFPTTPETLSDWSRYLPEYSEKTLDQALSQANVKCWKSEFGSDLTKGSIKAGFTFLPQDADPRIFVQESLARSLAADSDTDATQDSVTGNFTMASESSTCDKREEESSSWDTLGQWSEESSRWDTSGQEPEESSSWDTSGQEPEESWDSK